MLKRLMVVLVSVVLLFLAVRLAGSRGWLASSVIDDPPIEGRPECPRHDVVFVDSAGVWVPREAEIAGSGAITGIPEYHDCQRLRIGNPAKFGPLVAIFARIDLQNLADPPGFIPPVPEAGYHVIPAAGNTIAALPPQQDSTIPGRIPPVRPTTQKTATGVEQSVATILNYDMEDYGPLHIQKRYNCLYVYHALQGSNVWEASIVQATSDTDCLKPLSSWPSTTPLHVKPTYDPSPPPVARWDWDEAAKEHYVGIQCGTSWCEIWNYNRPNHRSSPSDRGSGKGWYDEQYLALKAPVAGTDPDDLTPGSAMGTVQPIGDLTSYEGNDGAAFAGTWIPVARVSLSEKSAGYEGKFKYHGGPVPYGKTFISMCKGTVGDCNFPLWDQLVTPRCGNDADPWWARIDSPLGRKFRCVIRRKPKDPAAPLPPGIVRWRWKLKDEGMWVRCPGGCCEKT